MGLQRQAHYAIALGSNRCHGRFGRPEGVIRAALAELASRGGIEARSAIIANPALGPAGRAFANAVAIVATDHSPDLLLAELKAIERGFGRRGGRSWGPRVLDLDVILWSEGAWGGPGPIIPHPQFRSRRFVLGPLAEIAPGWRDPVSRLTVRQLAARRRRAVPIEG